ncbi:MAG: SusD/RagB family nutrient-binding outer membrane lipoprotein [Candidatus Cyclobacteriaceae bacterium M2_1C_046]
MKINNLKIKSLFAGCFFLMFTACDMGDFGDLNNSPNATTEPLTSNLLTSALRGLGETVTATQGTHYVQHLANSQYTDADNYQTVNFSFNGFYAGELSDLDLIIRTNTNEETKVDAQRFGKNANQIAVAKILQAYYFHHMTDRWGDIPFTEALKWHEGEYTPAFDTQETVYNGIFIMLDEAVQMIEGDVDANLAAGDFLFGGDMTRWKDFANTTRMVAALRLSERNPGKAEDEFNAALDASGGVVSSNDENINYPYLAEANNQNPWFARFLTRTDYAIAEPLVEQMHTVANGGVLDVAMDPRLPIYANTRENSTEIVGMPYGLTQAQTGDWKADNGGEPSYLGDYFREQGQDLPIFSYAQVLFSMAEAAERNWIAGNAEDFYNEGIEASLEMYGVEDQLTPYMLNSEVAFDPARAMEQILTQKWIALYTNGYEAWAEWRRTGLPNLAPSPNAFTENGEIPTRQAYPVTERDLNPTSYDEAVSRLGGADNLIGKVWWDAN